MQKKPGLAAGLLRTVNAVGSWRAQDSIQEAPSVGALGKGYRFGEREGPHALKYTQGFAVWQILAFAPELSPRLAKALQGAMCLMGRTYTYRVNDGGNFCGHQPAAPRIALTEPVKKGKGGLPGVITEAMKRCTDYYKKPWKIPSLNLANGSHRQQRSERREACLSTLWAILKFTDLVTLKVGVPTPEGGFVNLTVKYLARQTGLTQRRVERALADIQSAGLVSVHPRCEKRADGSYKGLAAIKAVNKMLFSIFGLQFRLGFERKRAVKRLQKKQQTKSPGTRTAAARRNLTARAALDRAGTSIKRTGQQVGAALQQLGGNESSRNRKAKDDVHTRAADHEYQRQLNQLMFEFKMAHPDWDSEKCRNSAEEVMEKRWR